MRNRALLSAMAVCFAVAACESKKDEPPNPKAAQAVVPLPPEAPKPAAASANQDAKPVQPADAPKAGASNRKVRPGTKGCGNGKCVVNIKNITPGKRCTASYNAEKLQVAGQNETITWNPTGGWKFEEKGIELPVGGGQFSNPQGGGTNKFTVVDANSDDVPYKYTIRLVKGGEKCELDPSIVNGADTIDPDYPPQ